MSDLFSQNNFETQTENSASLKVLEAQSDLEGDFLSPTAKAKELGSQIDWVLTHRKAEYLPNLFELKKHKSVQVRRKVATGIGILGREENLFELKKWLVMEPDRTTWLILESTIDKLERGVLGQNLEKSVNVLSVSEAIGQIKRLVSEKTYIVEGELSDIKALKQMYYFALKDKEDSRIDCWGFVGKIVKAGFPLNEGLSVRVTGKFKLSKYSKIYFDIEKIELTGEGELLRNLKLLEEKLKNEGLFDPSRKRQIAKIPNNILLIASPNSAAISDFLQVLQKRRAGMKIYFLPIKTQGIGAEIEILEILNLTNQIIVDNSDEISDHKIPVDTIVLTRGGGSKDDLAVFNSERVVRAINALKKPIIVAIGHERDISFAELSADLRASTPSQAAELVSLSKNEILSQTHLAYSSCQNFFYQKKKDYLVYVNSVWNYIFNKVWNKTRNYKQICLLTDKILTNFLFKTNSKIQTIWQKILNNSYAQIYELKLDLSKTNSLQKKLLADVQNLKIETRNSFSKIYFFVQNETLKTKKEVEYLSKNLQHYDPKNILKKGFAIVKQDQKIVLSKSRFKSDSNLILEFYDGEIEVKS